MVENGVIYCGFGNESIIYLKSIQDFPNYNFSVYLDMYLDLYLDKETLLDKELEYLTQNALKITELKFLCNPPLDSIPSLPKILFKLKNLERLSFSSYCIPLTKQFLNKVHCFTKLKFLGIHNGIKQPIFLPSNFFKFEQLETLSVIGFSFEDTKDFTLGKIEKLTKLLLFFYHKNDLSETLLINAKNLNNLRLSNNYLPNDVFYPCTNLKSLEIDMGYLKKLPISLANLTNLEELNITSIEIESYPFYLENLSKLKKLSIHQSIFGEKPKELKVKKVPEFVYQLKELEILHVWDMDESDAPLLLDALPRLKSDRLFFKLTY